MHDTERRTELSAVYLPTSQRDNGRALSIAFDRATAYRSNATMHDLQLAARATVARLKGDGLPPEQMVVAVKALLRPGDRHEWEPSLDAPAEDGPAHARATIYAQLFHWCLDAYFGELRVGEPSRR